MRKPGSPARSGIARSAPVLAAAVATAMCALCHGAHSSRTVTVPGLDGLEQATRDARATLRKARKPRSADLVIVDTRRARAALETRDGWAALIEAIAAREPLAIAILPPLPYPEAPIPDEVVAKAQAARKMLAAEPTRTEAGEAALAALTAIEQALHGDERLAKSIAEAGNVYLGTAATLEIGEPGKPKIEPAALALARIGKGDAQKPIPRARYPYTAREPAVTIASVAQHARGGGFTAFVRDDDGVVRRAPAAVAHGKKLYMPLAMAVALARIGPRAEASFVAGDEFLAIPGNQVPISDHSTVLLSYLGPAGTFPRVDGAALLAGRGPRVTLAGKLVLIADPRGRRLQTPLGPMSEAEVTATFVHNLLFDEALVAASPLFTLLVIALIGAGLTALAARHRWRWIAPAAVWGVIGYALVAHILYISYGLVLEVAAPAIAAAVIAAAPLAARRFYSQRGSS